MVHRRVAGSGGDVQLAVTEAGDPDAATVLLVHGYPDTAAVWDEVADELTRGLHVVRHDVRGASGSSAPRGVAEYRMDRLVGDIAAVVDAASPDRPLHLVGHDWGSTQGWGALTDPRLRGRVASFTSISGPCLDHVGPWVRRRLARPSRHALRQLVGQALRSWYLVAFAIPGAAELAWRRALARRWPQTLARVEGISARPGHPAETLLADAIGGLNIYRANLAPRRRPRRPARIGVPVQVIVPTRDAYVSPALSEDLDRHTTELVRHDVVAGHWVIRSHPKTVARWIEEFVAAHEPSRSPDARELAGAST